MDAIGERIRKARSNAGLTQEQLANHLGTTKATISRWENGNVDNIAICKIERIAALCRVSPGWIMTWSEPTTLSKDVMNKAVCIYTIHTLNQTALHESNSDLEYVTENSDIDFCLRVKGNDMLQARIYDGDIAFIHRQSDVNHGEIALVAPEGQEAIIRRVYKVNGGVLLHAENPAVADILLSEKEQRGLKILGRVLYVKFEVR